jgi:hypothetical protein
MDGSVPGRKKEKTSRVAVYVRGARCQTILLVFCFSIS